MFVNRMLYLPLRLSTASPWCLLFAFRWLASFSDYGGDAAGAGGGGTAGEGGADVSAHSTLLLHGQAALRSLQFFCYAGC